MNEEGAASRAARPAGAARRLFFALWPNAPMRERLARAVRKAVRTSGGRPVPEANFHLTLAFLGSVPERRVGELATVAQAARQAAGIPGGPIEVPLERLVHWPQPRVLCVLPGRPCETLSTLARAVLESLLACGFAPDLKPFRPHVTVARKVTKPSASASMTPVRWRFEQFALIESRTLASGPVYSVVETYPLFIDR